MLLKTSKSVMVVVVEAAAVTEVAHVMVEAVAAAIEETLAAHVMAEATEVTLAVVHAMVADTKVQTHVVIAEAEMHVLQEAMVFLEVIAEASVALLQKKETVQLHAKVADTKVPVIAEIADHHALQEPIDQAHHVVTQVALQKPLLVTLTKKTNF